MCSESPEFNIESIRLANELEIKKRELAVVEKRLDLDFQRQQGNRWFELKIAIASILFSTVVVLGILMVFYQIYTEKGSTPISGSYPLPNLVGVDGIACVGQVQSLAGLLEIENGTLLDEVLAPTGKGKVCTAKVFSVTSTRTIYRVFDSSKPYTKFGGWWSFTPPSGSRGEHRAANAICPEWSKLDRLVKCEIRPGTEVVVGTTQSAKCENDLVFSKTAENQVFVANNGKDGIFHVGACAEEPIWQ